MLVQLSNFVGLGIDIVYGKPDTGIDAFADFFDARIHGLHAGHQRLRLVDHGLTGWNAGRHIRLGQYLQGFKKALQGRGDANVRVGNDAIQLIKLSFQGGVVAFHCCIGLHHFFQVSIVHPTN